MITEQELLASGQLGFVEVINGEMRRLATQNYKQTIIANNIYRSLRPASQDGILSRGQTSYALRRDEARILTMRVPDVSYMRHTATNATIILPVAPVLAIKVVAEYDTEAQLETVIRDYLNAGTERFWMVYPESEELHSYNRRAHQQRHTREDTIIVDDVFQTPVEFPVARCFTYPWD